MNAIVVESPEATELRETSGAPVEKSTEALPVFDAERYRPRESAFGRFGAWLAMQHWFWRLLRNVWPVPNLVRFRAITHYRHVTEVLSKPEVFRAAFASEITRLNGPTEAGTPFVLGIDDPDAHAKQLRALMRAFPRSDVAFAVDAVVGSSAARQLGGVSPSGGQIDVIRDLVTRVPLDVCRNYFGVHLDDSELETFAYATIAISGHLFGTQPEKEADTAEAANAGAKYVGAVIDRAVSRAERALGRGKFEERTVVDRLVGQLHAAEPKLTRDDLRAFLIGMIVGFVPTNTMAGGHIVQTLLRNRTAMTAARAASQAGDDDLLKRCLLETLRFRPHNPGMFRICAEDAIVGGDGPHAKLIKKGTKLLVSTFSAMFDEREISDPMVFNPDRPASDYLLFGYGLHWCAGAFIAQTQLTQTFKALLRHGEFAPVSGAAGSIRNRGGFPDHLTIEFRGPAQ
jgi:cytochrome P450